ncbi:hypothetical protein A3D84_04430 [Candidatus Woesebacteria bacterium RIFCSPHIGHO2_02_FULL_42_20]|uniref:Uncharacterized protein n=1 Tax=Candidatus Woesebacteria bacterium RIFCSPHIGHO2_12_FULL_41_24 TaxID=1802510 RepID=A0A1F8AVQ2_9BACT|nr:MAG: hypothetical protein A2W15_02170 [Candidatus Woesebacteria bacterium RBG_16_41_13]OGM30185.1 MAG: hypothetical protein A2873_03565 [Candidatus Woesebacteria bacterium RIFCSPHIGHO2_01_FULL_42_80]OGM34228.1 MAG: hypothetical protein A3D84_04430 [Candidatus Woesebacteria bacterium RIFCSPHIGHO2_02_FULL_42_20]OGM55315.1 MAG: hypothetical protein A3E44_03465 [Candidatus Woesebacteria bacterium RIFCSPHIGHO2_12_FULL_41_24]OGM67983.1 MAG: hypothetical protein A2969_03065 [Candidatus Woesebacteri
MEAAVPLPFRTFDFHIGKLAFSPNYFQAVLVVFLIFLLIFSLARLRHMYVHWSFKGATAYVVMGFLLAIIVEGFMLLAGRTVFTEIVGWENAPRPLAAFITTGRERLVNVLGTETEVPLSVASESQDEVDEIVSQFQTLSPDAARRARYLICEP